MTELADLLAAHRPRLVRFVQSRGGRVLRYESAEDLVQGVHLRALERGEGFEYRGEEPFVAWLRAVATTYVADRCAYWTALRRRPAALLRLTRAGGTDGAGAAGEPAGTATGPATFAERREALADATRALAILPERDRRILGLVCEGRTVGEIADELGLGYAAADKARTRALDRFRKAHRIVTGT